jgi:hypothetical protein
MSRKKRFGYIIILTLVLSLFLPPDNSPNELYINATAEPEILGGGDFNMTATWNFDNASDYVLYNLTMENGEVNLTTNSFWWNQTTYGDFEAGSLIDANNTLNGDVVLEKKMTGVNIVKTGDFSLYENWTYSPGDKIFSFHNNSGGNAELSYRYFTGSNIIYLVPLVGEDDGTVSKFIGFPAYYVDNSSTTTDIGWEDGVPWPSSHRSFFYFDLKQIPQSATIDNVFFYAKIQDDSNNASHLINISSLENERDSVAYEFLYQDCVNGNLYVSSNDSLKNGAAHVYHEWNLTNLAVTDLQVKLNDGWFGIGIREENDDNERAKLNTTESADPPQLNVTYTLSGPVTFDDTAYVNQTFNKPDMTPNDAFAVNLSFDYTVEKLVGTTAEIIVKIDDMTVWNGTVTDNESNTIYLDVGDIMIDSGDYDISLQLNMDITSQTAVECVVKYDNVNITTLGYSWLGTYTSEVFDAGSNALWDEISWNVSTPQDTGFAVRTASSLDNSTWSKWSYEYSIKTGDMISSSPGRYFIFTFNLTTTNYTQTPVLSDVNISYKKYCFDGSIEMKDDLWVENLFSWGIFQWEAQTNGQDITYEYSIDRGGAWNLVPIDGNLTFVDIFTGRIRFRAKFTTYDTSTTPTLYKWNLTYKTSALANLFGLLNPGFGFINTRFNFSVRYTDLDNDSAVSLTLNITGGTSNLGSWDMLPFELDPNDTNNTDGKWYYLNMSNFARGTNYTFHFAAEDPTGLWVESETKDGPFVLNSEPRIITSNDQGAEEGLLYYVDYEAEDLEDTGNLIWSRYTNSSWLNINPSNGTLYGIPPTGIQGSYWVNVTVNDGFGGVDWTNFSLVVGDTIAPIANAGSDGVAYEDVPHPFDGTNSSDNSGVLNFTWYFGDGSIGYGGKPTHIYIREGSYLVAVIVKDPLNNENMDVINVTVINNPPVADAGGDRIVNEGETVEFNGSGSIDTVSDMNNLLLLWDFDNDGFFDDGLGVNPIYTWYDNETVNVRLMVIDDNGDVGIDNITVLVQNVVPSVYIEREYYTGEKGSEMIIIAYASDVRLDDLEYRWDWENDGTFDTEWSFDFVVRNTWSTVDNYTIRIQVRDDDGGFGTDTAMMNITKRRVPPVIQNLGSRQVRYLKPFPVDLSSYITDEDTPLSDLVVSTSDDQNISISGLVITLIYPPEAINTDVSVEVFVTDGTFIDSEFLTVSIRENNPPTLQNIDQLDAISQIQFNEDEELNDVFNLNDFFNDDDPGDELTFEIYNDEPSLRVTIDANGLVSFSTKRDWAGNATVRFGARDPSNAYAEFGLFVTVISVNDPPIIRSQLGFTTLEKENKTWTINLWDYFYDVDDEELLFTCSHSEIKIDQLNGTATWVPGDKKKLNNVVFTANDGENEVSLDAIDLKIFEPEPLNWLLVIMPFVLGLLVFAAYREIRYRYSIEEVFLVDNAGVLLVHMSRGESKAIDAKLVSGMLTAVQEFVKDSFMGNNEIDDIKLDNGALGKLEYGDFQIVIERGEYTFLSAVISGYDNKRLRNRMKDVVLEFETQYLSTLKDWDGDMAKFDGADKIVGRLLKAPSSGPETPKEEIEMKETEEPEEAIINEYDLPSGDFGDIPSTYDENVDENQPPPG